MTGSFCHLAEILGEHDNHSHLLLVLSKRQSNAEIPFAVFLQESSCVQHFHNVRMSLESPLPCPIDMKFNANMKKAKRQGARGLTKDN